ncbi:ROK family protein [Pseudonocardia petroleophila]|uniref:ROK family transcriptional regulator n=1 Tax=Pseudonocardia petroleophila TaxID=37331 RepID=A0A7G7MDD5_9PSEU|nr:ROK family transcriptional regulator [Pseudonocardia petroleophila]QNG50796.1 ROK family transcriptional regulator [Pseudonocardia petroleophila]
MSGTDVVRRLNTQAVLDVVLDAGRSSGADLMARTGLSRPTVHAVCDDLIERGWLVEPPRPGTARPGRPARIYAPRPGAGFVLAVDMGATSVRAAVADLGGAVAGEAAAVFAHEHVPAADRLALTRGTCRRALDAAGAAPEQLLGAVLGVPAPVDACGRASADEDYLPGLAALDLRTALAPVVPEAVVENDANLAVAAERWRGVAHGVDDVVLVLAGERLGAGVCLGGRVVRGHRGGVGEMGFLDLVDGVGGTAAIGNLVRRWGSAELGRTVRAEQVVAAAGAGDPAARAVLDAVARRIARALAVLATLLDPELLVVGGAVAAAGEVLLAPLRREVARVAARPVRLAASTLADRGVLLGAVRVALDDVRPRLLDLRPAR